MEQSGISFSRLERLMVAFAVVVMLSVAAMDVWYWHTSPLAEGWPDASMGHLLRSGAILLAVAMVLGLFSRRRAFFALFAHHDRRLAEMLAIGIAWTISLCCLLLFVWDPALFSAQSLEDATIEWGSALLLFAGWLVLLLAFLKARYTAHRLPIAIQLSLALLSALLFVIAMEEVSWFQRVFDVTSTGIFADTPQHETNLHNFATDYFENAYYLGTYIFTVIIPFAYALFPSFSSYRYLRIFVASPFLIVIGSIQAAYNFDMWNIMLTQAAFFASVIILLLLALRGRDRQERWIGAVTLVLLVVTQGVFLSHGERFARLWEVTEYKEFFIAMALFFYALHVLSVVKRETVHQP